MSLFTDQWNTETFNGLAQVPQAEALSVVEEIKISERPDHFFSGPELYEAEEHTILVQEGLCRCRGQTQPLLFGGICCHLQTSTGAQGC